MTCTGSMWQIEFSTSSPSQSTGVFTTRRQSTWRSVVSLSRISLVVSDCAQHTVASLMYRAIDEQHSAVGRSLSLDQPSGIRFQTSLEKRLRTLSGCHWWRRFSDNISVFSALEVFYDNALYKSMFYLLTYLLAYIGKFCNIYFFCFQWFCGVRQGSDSTLDCLTLFLLSNFVSVHQSRIGLFVHINWLYIHR